MEIVVVVVPLILHNKEDRNFGQRINTRGWLLLNIRAVQTDTSFLKITHVSRRRKQEDAPLRLVIYQGVATIISTTRKLFAIIIIPSHPDSRYIMLHACIFVGRRHRIAQAHVWYHPPELGFPTLPRIVVRFYHPLLSLSLFLSPSFPLCNEVSNEVFRGNKIATCFQFTKHKFRFICRDDLLRRIINIRGYVICCAILAGVYCCQRV